MFCFFKIFVTLTAKFLALGLPQMWIARLLQLQAEEILLFYVQKWGKYR